MEKIKQLKKQRKSPKKKNNKYKNIKFFNFSIFKGSRKKRAIKLLTFPTIIGPILIAMAVIVLFAVIILDLNLLGSKKESINLEEINFDINNIASNDKDKDNCSNCIYDPLTGNKSEISLGYPLAVIIDNHLDARPALGLSEAKLVYEFPVEGGITRYLAIFSSEQKLKEIGPIRSARPYFIDMLQPLQAVFVHCGGSPESLVNIITRDIIDLNEFYNEDYFWRDESRPEPHNVITSSKKLKKYLDKENLSQVKIEPWLFNHKEDKSESNIISPEILIKYRADRHEVIWKYNAQDKKYVRSLAGEEYRDAEGNLITAKTVIISEYSSKIIDEKLRLKIQTQGEGEAVVCSLGECQKATWKKKSNNDRERYYIKNKELKFPAGNFWIEIVDENTSYTY